MAGGTNNNKKFNNPPGCQCDGIIYPEAVLD